LKIWLFSLRWALLEVVELILLSDSRGTLIF
jgi:hypothetical protein